jgi:hypothetical protein
MSWHRLPALIPRTSACTRTQPAAGVTVVLMVAPVTDREDDEAGGEQRDPVPAGPCVVVAHRT